MKRLLLLALLLVFAFPACAQTSPGSADPCNNYRKTTLPISTSASVILVNGTVGKKIYICSINLIAAGAVNASLVAGTGTICATNLLPVIGGATAALGWNFGANGGISHGNGAATIAATTVNTADLCILLSGQVLVAGGMTYVKQ